MGDDGSAAKDCWANCWSLALARHIAANSCFIELSCGGSSSGRKNRAAAAFIPEERSAGSINDYCILLGCVVCEDPRADTDSFHGGKPNAT